MDVAMVMFKSNGEPRVFRLRPGQTVIGRREDCDLRIPLSEISRKHAVITVKGDQVSIRDLGSANGTYINNVRITEQVLSAGDHVVIGPVVFTIQIDGKPADLKPVKTRLEARRPTHEEEAVLLPGKAGGIPPADIADLDLAEGDEDPISALEAMATSDETAQLDLDDSRYRLDDIKND